MVIGLFNYFQNEAKRLRTMSGLDTLTKFGDIRALTGGQETQEVRNSGRGSHVLLPSSFTRLHLIGHVTVTLHHSDHTGVKLRTLLANSIFWCILSVNIFIDLKIKVEF